MNQKLILSINVMLSLLVIPFLILFLFNHPTPEDFFWSEITRDNGFIEAQKIFYNTWSGRYFSYALLSINPLLLKSFLGYKIFLLVIFTLFVYVSFIFISAFTKKSLSLNERLLITFSVLFIYLYSMPSVSEGFYWITAVMIYTLGIILIMLYAVSFKKISETNNLKLRNLYIIISAVLLFAISGTSEINSFLILILNLTLLLYNFRTKNSMFKISLILTAIACISVLFSFASPGNLLRSGEFENAHNFISSFKLSFVFLFKNLSIWIFSPLLIFTILLTPLLMKLELFREKSRESISTQLLRIIFLNAAGILSLIYLVIFFTVWNTGESPYGRTLNIAFIIFLFGWFYTYILILQYAEISKYITFFSKHRIIIIFITVIIFSLFIIKKNNIRNVYSDLFQGVAYTYNQKLDRRYQLITNDKSGTTEVDSIKNIPRSFFLYDITSDPDHFYNQWYSNYFDKNSIRLK